MDRTRWARWFGAVLGEAYLIGAFGLYGTSVAAGVTLCIAAAVALSVAKFEATRDADLIITDQSTLQISVELRRKLSAAVAVCFSSALGRA